MFGSASVYHTLLISLMNTGLGGNMLEKDIERKLNIKAKTRGCIEVKLISASFNGLPDRIILSPDGKASFIELKAPGKKPRPLQLKGMHSFVP